MSRGHQKFLTNTTVLFTKERGLRLWRAMHHLGRDSLSQLDYLSRLTGVPRADLRRVLALFSARTASQTGSRASRLARVEPLVRLGF